MPNRVEGRVMVENARIIFRNFSGKKTDYNEAGKRNFSVILDERMAEDLLRDGWNVKRLKPREDDDNPIGTPHLKVNVNFDPDKRPPQVVLIGERSRNRKELDVDTVGVLDVIDIVNVDMVFNPFNWTSKRDGTSGVSAYLKSIFVTQEEGYLDMKYSDTLDENDRAAQDY